MGSTDKTKVNKKIKIFMTLVIILFAYALYILLYNYVEVKKEYGTLISKDALRHIVFSPNICAVRNTTGFPCPGCGMTRAYLSLFSLNVKKAFFYHPLFILPFFLFLILLLQNKIKAVKSIMKNQAFWTILLVVVLSVWVIRFIIFFPHTEPFTYYKESALANVFKFILSLFRN